ncbi:MAG TPA: hypothetical protein VL172_11470 [Kofleriaceae bacterium]|nr:hypothetical protein [Kofleriaceae bacterium]
MLAGLLLLAGCESQAALAPGEESCLQGGCHERVENIHYGAVALACVDCHGGDGRALTKESAHPTVSVSFNPATPGVHEDGGRLLLGASLAELDDVDPEVLQFLNPADYRVVEQTCGSTTRGGGNCHTRISQSSVLSTHATLGGQLAGGLYFGGLTDRRPLYGVVDIADPFASTANGFVAGLERFPEDVADVPGVDGDVARGYFATFGQLCVECHLGRDGGANPGKYTSSGCNACHLLTADDGKPRTTDPTQQRDEIGHGARHRLTNLIPDAQCNRCHHAHLHRGLLAQGVRERSEPDGDLAMGGPNRGQPDPAGAVFWSADHYVRANGGYYLYDKPFPFYIEDEDGSNDVDETPPDIHTEKGMGCIDCHTMQEVHGSEHLAARREFETKVRCETCHGTPQAPVVEGQLPFQIALSRPGGTADNPPAITRNADGDLVQRGKLDQADHKVTQINHRLDPADAKFNPRTLMGCGLHSGNAAFRAQLAALFSATDSAQIDEVFPGMPEGATLPADVGERDGRLECFTCHNAWTVNCYGCHVERDDRVSATDHVSGRVITGKISNFPMSVVADALALGTNTRQRISPMVGTSIFFTHIGPGGEVLVNAAPLRTVDGFSGAANQHNPVHHHTVRRQPRDCIGCHPRADGVPDDQDALKRAIGFGTGRFLFVDGTGKRHLLDAQVVIDFDGDTIFDDPETTPLGAEAFTIAPLATSTHLPLVPGTGPGPLDRDAINRMLQNHVVPQR